MPEKEKPVVAAAVPKTLGACADKAYELRQCLSELKRKQEKEREQLEVNLKAIEEHLIATLPKSEANGVAGRKARVQIFTAAVPKVADWDKLYSHIKKTGSFDLLGRSLSKEAVWARWERKKSVPGVETFDVVKVSINKL